VLLATGTGATLARGSGVRDGEFLIAIDVHSVPNASAGGARPGASEPLVRVASLVDREWLVPTRSELTHRFDASQGRVRAAHVDRYDALVLGEHPIAPDPSIAAPLLAAAWIARGPRDEDRQLLRRLAFAGATPDIARLAETAAFDAKTIDDLDIRRALSPVVARDLDREAPERLPVPSGRSHRLEYHDDGSVSLEVKLQELFGLADTPRIGKRRMPVTLALLAPNGRPVQVTQDLRSFWNRTYPEVRKELRGRYPRHPWPEDPWSAPPTARTRRKG
jgi:ATP-dependent helicase HrpB